MSETKRTKLVVWSGGLDSTLVLHNLAKESSLDNPVIAVSFIPDFLNPGKVKKEEEVRNNYLAFAEKNGLHVIYRTININSDLSWSNSWTQQRVWFLYVLPFIDDDTDLYFGYVGSDCVIPAIRHFVELFETHKYIGSCYNADLHFPLMYKKKWEVLKEFKEAGIPEDCFWTCEDPIMEDGIIEPCGECEPCMNLKVGKYALKLRNKINRNGESADKDETINKE